MRKASFLWQCGCGRDAGLTHQQLRLKTLSRRVKLGFMAGTLGGAGRFGLQSDGRGGDTGGRRCSRGTAYRWPPGSRAPRKAAALKCTRLGADSRVTQATGRRDPNLAARQPGKALCGESWC